MSTPLIIPPIQGGIYRISSIFPELYLELQRDASLRAAGLNIVSEAQQWRISPHEDGTYEIRCIWGNYELPCETYSAHKAAQPQHRMQVWTIDARGVSFIIANAYDYRALDLLVDNMVGFSDRNNVRGQRWVLHPVKLDDDTSLSMKMAAMQPISGAGDPRLQGQQGSKSFAQGHQNCPTVSPQRVLKTPAKQGVILEGIYRIASAIRKNDTVGFLELQQDGNIKAVPLNEASQGQKWVFTYNENSKYYIKSSLNSHALAFRPSPNNPNLTIAVGEDSFATPWTIEPRHDTYFIGAADEERVLDLTNNNLVVGENLDGCTTQRWDLAPVRVQCQPTFREGIRYLIRNHATGSVWWMKNNGYTLYGHDDGDTALQFTFKNQEDGGTAICCNGLWGAPGLATSTSEHSYRFIPAGAGSKYYFICPEMTSDPPNVAHDKGGLGLDTLYESSENQMWELVPKLG